MMEMKHLKRGRLALALMLMLAVALGGFAEAAAEEASASSAASKPNSIGYAVRALLPDNQLDASALYFDLRVEPGQRQTLQVVVMNRGEQMEVAVEANTAFTNANGVIEFTHSDERDESLAVDFAEIVTPVSPVITVPAYGEAIAEFTLDAPDRAFDGTVYGGLMFTKLHQGEDEGDGGVSIGNVYRYVIGVRLRQSEAEVEPEFELLDAEIDGAFGPAQAQALMFRLRNPRPLIARGIALKAWVHPADGGASDAGAEAEALAVFERDNIAMAPNSSMRYALPFDTGAAALEPGAYRVAVELRFGEDTWRLEAPLSVD